MCGAATTPASLALMAAVYPPERRLRIMGYWSLAAAGSPVVALLVKAAELHVRADLGVVDAAEHDLTPDVLAALRFPAADPSTQSSSA